MSLVRLKAKSDIVTITKNISDPENKAKEIIQKYREKKIKNNSQ